MSSYKPNVLLIGLGRVGLPQALVLADAGWNVCGVDVDLGLINDVSSGKAPFFEPGMAELLTRVLASGKFSVTDHSQLHNLVPLADYTIVSVGTPFDNKSRRIDQEGLFGLMRHLLGLHPRFGATIVLRTSVPVGTTDHIRNIGYEEFNLKEGEDYHLVYVPERVAEGKAVQEELTLPKLMGAYSDQGFQKGVDLFECLGADIVRLSSPAAAEFAKLVDNSFRNTLFAFANELARAAEDQDLDVWEIIQACNSGYPRNNIPIPGPVSGYCLKKDPYLLSDSLLNKSGAGATAEFIWERARQDNDNLFYRAASEIAKHIQELGLKRPQISVLGLAFKEGVDDFRMSHVFDIIRALRKQVPDLVLSLYDPAVNSNRYTQLPEDIASLVQRATSCLDEARSEFADVVLVATPDASLRKLSGPADLVNHSPGESGAPTLVYDCWNIWRGAQSTKNVIYRALGVGSPVRQGQ